MGGNSMRYRVSLFVMAVACVGGVSSGATKGIIDDFTAAGTAGWGSQSNNSNPGTGGIGGTGDGYLLVVTLPDSFPGYLGSQSSNPSYAGDWVAAGITEATFYLNDVGSADPLEIHFLLTGGPLGGTTWQYNVGFQPPNGTWQRYTVDASSGANWTQTRGAASFQDVLRDVARIHFRHDVAPYVGNPDPLAADLGVDEIALGPACNNPPQDADGDGDVDLVDFGVFQGCFNGPNRPWVGGATLVACICLDADGDADVDLVDFGAFQGCFNGPNRPPACP
jgi:hypothetical protein